MTVRVGTFGNVPSILCLENFQVMMMTMMMMITFFGLLETVTSLIYTKQWVSQRLTGKQVLYKAAYTTYTFFMCKRNHSSPSFLP